MRIDNLYVYGKLKDVTYLIFEPRHEVFTNVVCATSRGSDQPAHNRSLIRAFATRLNILKTVKLLTEQHLEFLSLKGGCTGSSDSIHVKCQLLEISCCGSITSKSVI